MVRFSVSRFIRLFGICVILIVYVACKPSTPNGVMSEGKLENVLYDYNLAIAMAESLPAKNQDEREKNRYEYVQKVFQQHGITEEYFDSTMVWYAADGNRLHSILTRLNDRLDAEAKSLGVDLSETEIYANYTADGDTANIWNGSRILYMSNYQPDNVKVISIPVDSTFLPGDTYKLSFHGNFLPSQGSHSVYAMFCVYYSDNSVVSAVQQVGGSYKTELNLKPNERQDSLLPKHLTITFYAPPVSKEYIPSLFYLTYPSVLRMHKLDLHDDTLSEETGDFEKDTLSIENSSANTDTVGRRLSPIEERDNREVHHDINIVKERIVRPASRPATQRRNIMR